MMPTPNPFDILPGNLFNLFSTQGYTTLQRHYMAILLRLYQMAELNRFGLTREVVVDEIIEYLKSEKLEKEIAAEMENQPDASEPAPRRADLALYAGYLLRRMTETGWIEIEQHADYSETILLPDYAFTLLEALRSIQEQKPHQFTGQLYTAHQLITSANANKDFSPALAVSQAFENVRQVVRGLSELNQNIRRYIERATAGKTPAEILRIQFNDYAQTLGNSYHALKTSDHVSRYRRDIIHQAQNWLHDADWQNKTAQEFATQGRLSPAQAEQEISHYLQFIVNQLENLDPLVEDIDRRHSQYMQTSLRQIRYQLVSADGSFKDRLTRLAQTLSVLKEEGMFELPGDAPGLLRNPLSAPDLHSLYTPPTRRGVFAPAALQPHVIQPAELLSLQREILQDVRHAVSPQRVNRMVRSFFNGHRTLSVKELPQSTLADIGSMVAIISYAYHPEVEYGLELTNDEPVAIGAYRMASFNLVKLWES